MRPVLPTKPTDDPTSELELPEMSEGLSLTSALLLALENVDHGEREAAIIEAARYAEPTALIEAVGDHDDSIRRNAAMQALTKGAERTVPTLLQALRHSDPEVVLFSINVLGRTRDRSAIPHLIPLIEHADPNVAHAAVESLANLHASSAVDAIVRLLQGDAWLRMAAIHALGEIGDPRGVKPLAPLLSEEGEEEMIMQALGRIGSPEALRHLAKAIQETTSSTLFIECLRAIGDALGRLPDHEQLAPIEEWQRLGTQAAAAVHQRLADVLSSPATKNGGESDLEVKAAAAAVIRTLRLRPLYELLVAASGEPELRERLRYCAVSIGQDIGPAIASGLEDSNAAVRAFACECSGAIGLASANTRLVSLLHDESVTVRAAAISSLAALQSLEAITDIVDLLDTADAEVGAAAERALGRLDAHSVSRALVRDGTRSLEGHHRALRVAESNPHPAQRTFIIASLSHRDAGVRAAAVKALGEQNVTDVVPLVEYLLLDPAVVVRKAAVDVLGRSNDRRSRELLLRALGRDPSCAPPIVRALARSGDATIVPRLIELLPSAGPDLRVAIIEAVARLNRAAAEPVLVRLLSDSDVDTRRTAVYALCEVPSPATLAYIHAAARDKAATVRCAVASALPARSEVMTLLEGLSVDPDPQVSKVAKGRLAELDVMPRHRSIPAGVSLRPTTPATTFATKA